MLINLDRHQILYYLEGCAHGSHLRQGCWYDMIKLYPDISQSMRDFLYYYAKRDIAPIFEVGVDGHRPCGAEDFDQFLACFDKDNWYLVTAKDGIAGINCPAYLFNGKYMVDEQTFINEKYILDVQKIELFSDEEE